MGALLGKALEAHGAGRLDAAQALYEQLLAQDPENIDALHFLGVVEYQRGRHARAEQLIARAIGRNANNPAAHNNLGTVLVASGRLAEAAEHYRTAVALQPGYVDAYINLGSALIKLGRTGEAASWYEKGVAAAPGSAQLRFSLASTQSENGLLEEALAGFRKALSLKPDYTEAQLAMGTVLLGLARIDEADSAYATALALKPGLSEARFGRALAKLMQGNYAEGFALFEARFEKSALSGPMYATLPDRHERFRRVPRWNGEERPGKALLVWTDQGFGDTLMFMRYLGRIKPRGFAKVVVLCEPALARVIRTVSGVDEVMVEEALVPLVRFDYQCPMSSLPLAFSTRLDSIPNEVPYIVVPRALQAGWAARLASVPHPRVGLLWAGRPDFPKDALRSIRLERFAPLLAVPGIRFVSLQKGAAAGERAQCKASILDFMDDCTDLLETAALMCELDLVIGVDTGATHLAAALGRPTWLLNRFESEWRWMLGRENCAWYPTMKIFSQRTRGDWDEVMRRAADALRVIRI